MEGSCECTSATALSSLASLRASQVRCCTDDTAVRESCLSCDHDLRTVAHIPLFIAEPEPERPQQAPFPLICATLFWSLHALHLIVSHSFRQLAAPGMRSGVTRVTSPHQLPSSHDASKELIVNAEPRLFRHLGLQLHPRSHYKLCSWGQALPSPSGNTRPQRHRMNET